MPVLDVYLSKYLQHLATYCRIYIHRNNFDKKVFTVVQLQRQQRPRKMSISFFLCNLLSNILPIPDCCTVFIAVIISTLFQTFHEDMSRRGSQVQPFLGIQSATGYTTKKLNTPEISHVIEIPASLGMVVLAILLLCSENWRFSTKC